jgi:hypothetical protein
MAAFLVWPALGESTSAWASDPTHPQLQYRIKCQRGSTYVQWRNSYPGEVSVRAGVRSAGYDGVENITIPPNGNADSDVDTLNCSPDSFRVSLQRFSMKPPPPPPAKPGDAKTPAPAPPQIFIPKYVPPQKLPEVSSEALASVKVGMRQEEVVHALGAPASKVTIPEDSQLMETYRYRLARDKVGVIRFSNGVVVEILTP